MGVSSRHQEIVAKLLDANAVNFEAIGRVFAEHGASLSLIDEPEDWFCGTMRTFIRLYRINTPFGGVENLAQLGSATTGLRQQ